MPFDAKMKKLRSGVIRRPRDGVKPKAEPGKPKAEGGKDSKTLAGQLPLRPAAAELLQRRSQLRSR